MTDYPGLIIISHQTFSKITEQEIINSLPKNWKDIPRQIVKVNPIETRIGEEQGLDWKSVAREQADIYKNSILPALESYPTYGLLYFGLANIPLAIHLGYLMGSIQKCEIFQKEHQSNTWVYEGNTDLPSFNNLGVPKERIIAHGEVSLRFSTYYDIKDEDVLLFPETPAAHLKITSENSEIDSFTSNYGGQFAGMEFRKTLDNIKHYLPNVSKIHLFAAVPVGVAFSMGKQVSPTIHHDKKIHIYNYQNSKYEPCFVLQSIERDSLKFDDKELTRISVLRQEVHNCLERQIKPYLKGKENENIPWYNLISDELQGSLMSESSWKDLPQLAFTNLSGDQIDLQDTKSSAFYQNQSWIISDNFLGAIFKRFRDNDSKILIALRMFLFHEALHFAFQRLTENTAQGIGRFPKVLERADYEADVWAMFQEYGFSKHYNMVEGNTPQDYFAMLHESAVDTMWAFDIAESDPAEMQMRRIIRYLSLYFNLARIKDPKVKSLSDIANCLGNAPVIDLKGLKLKTDGEGRVIAQLYNFQDSKLGIGVYHANKVYTLGSLDGSFQIRDLITALRDRNSQEVENFARKIWDRVKF